VLGRQRLDYRIAVLFCEYTCSPDDWVCRISAVFGFDRHSGWLSVETVSDSVCESSGIDIPGVNHNRVAVSYELSQCPDVACDGEPIHVSVGIVDLVGAD
jgi:hypothetical protein